MESGLIIFLTFLISLGIISIYNYWLHKKKKRDLLKIELDWNNFLKAVSKIHIEGISKFGSELIWNEHFSMIKLKEMSELINNMEKLNPEIQKSDKLKKLKSLIYNKYLHWNMEYPFAGRKY